MRTVYFSICSSELLYLVALYLVTVNWQSVDVWVDHDKPFILVFSFFACLRVELKGKIFDGEIDIVGSGRGAELFKGLDNLRAGDRMRDEE